MTSTACRRRLTGASSRLPTPAIRVGSVAGYTAQFGNGFSATIALEQRRITQIINAAESNTSPTQFVNVGSVNTGAFPGALSVSGSPSAISGVAGFAPGAGAYGGFQMPDIVANLRVDQAWGSAQIMGALHQVNALYYMTTGSGAANRNSGHPSDELGWVVGAGIKLNAPMIGQGDYFQAQVNYTEGALRYIFMTPNSNWGKIDGAGIAYGVLSDAVYGGYD